MKFALRAREVVRCAHSEVLRLCRKVKLSVPHIVPKAHFTGTPETRFTRFGEPLSRASALFTSEGHFTFREAEHLVEKPRLREVDDSDGEIEGLIAEF